MSCPCPPGSLPHGTHQEDGNGGCTICRIYVEHSDDEYLVVGWPCPASRLFNIALSVSYEGASDDSQPGTTPLT